MNIKRNTGKIIHLLGSLLYALVSTRPKRECFKAILFSFPGAGFLWKRKWQQWQSSRIWFDQKQKQRLFRSYPFLVRKSFTLFNAATQQQQHEKIHSELQVLQYAIVIHVYYPEVFESMLEMIHANLLADFPLYITMRPEISPAVEEILHRSGRNALLHTMENRGRDIGPFLSLLPILRAQGITAVLKLHTKKSMHLGSADHPWLSDILSQLVEEGAIEKHFLQLQNNQRIGMIAPYGHVVPMAFYYGDNTEKMLGLVKKWNIPSSLLGSAIFVAGSMFYIRLASIEAMLSQPILLQEFETESGQTDGTLAHAVERMFSLLVYTNNYWVTDTNKEAEMVSCTIFSDHMQSR